MDIPPSFARDQLLDPLPCLVEVTAMLDDLCAVSAYGGVLLGIVADRHENPALHAMDPACKSDRLSVITCAGAHHATAMLVRRELRDQIEAAANLERPCRIVVFVLD